jgi:hypothetical protein
MNKQLFWVMLFSVLVGGCAEKDQYEQVVLEEMQKEQDVKDYHIDPEHMAKCVIETSYHKMPGFMPFDPDRLEAYKNYTKMLTLSHSKEPQKTLEELRKDFGSPQKLAEAHSNFTESMMECFAAISHEGEDDDKSEDKPTS